jgi:hypothetical protein
VFFRMESSKVDRSNLWARLRAPPFCFVYDRVQTWDRQIRRRAPVRKPRMGNGGRPQLPILAPMML